MVLAFMCTGPRKSFDPVCNSEDMMLLLFLSLALGVATAAVLSDVYEWTVGRTVVMAVVLTLAAGALVIPIGLVVSGA